MTDRPTDGVSSPSLQELCAVNTAQPWCIDLLQPELSGGRTTAKDLDAIAARPDATALRVSGLDQKTFELLITRYGSQFEAMYFWKNGRLADLTPLETMPQLRLAGFYVNQRTTRLWDLRRSGGLTGLRFENFTRLHALDDLEKGVALQELDFGDALWNTPVFESLAPLAALTSLRRLSFNARRITDGRIQPLASLTRLEWLAFPPNLFTTTQVAWLKAHLPGSVQSHVLGPLFRMGPIRDLSDNTVTELDRNVLVMGKRKPALNSQRDAARIQRYVEEFETLVQRFRDDPGAQPD
jgi:hypothetical protein